MNTDTSIIIIDNQRYFYDKVSDSLVLLNNENLQNKSDKINYKSNNDELDNTMNLNEWYMENYDIDFWENILSRNLDSDEIKLIHNVWNETSLNIDIQMLQQNIIDHNCYIKSITKNLGNCLFESLAELGLGDNDFGINKHEVIRKNIASVLLIMKTEIGFFPKIDLTPEELFKNINDIEFVKNKLDGQIYEYDYDMMIYDLSTNFSWEII